MRDLLEEAVRWDLEPKTASPWWNDQKKKKNSPHKFPFAQSSKNLGHIFNPAEIQDSLDVPWRMHAEGGRTKSTACSGLGVKTGLAARDPGQTKQETQVVRRLFRSKRQDDET